MIEKILLADSGIGNTKAMMEVLLELPLIQRAAVTALHVVPSQTSSEDMTRKWEEGGRLLAKTVNDLKLDPTKVNAVLREGEPKDVVLTVANEIDAGLIVIGSRGLQGLRAILDNSVSQYVFQLSSRPMLLVKDDLYKIRPIRRILVALDKSDSAKEGLKIAINMLRDNKGELILVHSISNLKARPFDEVEPDPSADPILKAAAAEAGRYKIPYKIGRASCRERV